ncbi:MAG TPA: cytochrome c biogenesis protein CcsA [Acidimicrobiia bacterium]
MTAQGANGAPGTGTAPAGARRVLSRTASRVLAAVTLAAVALRLVMGLFVAPSDSAGDPPQGQVYRLLFLHVPSAWVAYLAFGVTAMASILYLIPRTRGLQWDHLAGASAELGVIFTALVLVEGSLWGKPVWGAWWAWDARLTTTAVLFFLYLGYLALRRIGGSPHQRSMRSAIAALIAFIDVPIVHFSVTWWTTLHQDGSIFNQKMQVHIQDARMNAALIVGVVASTLVYASLCIARMRLLALEEGMEERELQAAIEERLAARRDPSASSPAPQPVVTGSTA